MNTPIPPHTSATPPDDAYLLGLVRAIFKALAKYMHARVLYAPSNPTLQGFSRSLDAAFQAYFAQRAVLRLSIEQYRITCQDETVYENTDMGDSIAFRLFKDGVGEIVFHKDVTWEEIERFVDAIKPEAPNKTNPVDMATRLWNADFACITHRVLAEQGDGDGDSTTGTGTSGPNALSHPDHALLEDGPPPQVAAATSDPTASMGDYIRDFLRRSYPNADTRVHEQQTQELMRTLFSIDGESLNTLKAELAYERKIDPLIRFLKSAFEFTLEPDHPSLAEIVDTINYIVSYVGNEADAAKLINVVDLLERYRNEASNAEVKELVDLLLAQFAEHSFLCRLGSQVTTSEELDQVLQYYRRIGTGAVAATREMFALTSKPAYHKALCDALLDLAGEDIDAAIDGLQADNALMAQDIAYLHLMRVPTEVPAVIKTFVSSTNPQVREVAPAFLAQVETDESAGLLVQLLEDSNKSVRMKTLVVAEEITHSAVVEKVRDQCFVEDVEVKDMGELECLFRAVGKLGGNSVLRPLSGMVDRKRWFKLGSDGARRRKLLALTALRHIPTSESRQLIMRIADDNDPAVAAKARFILKSVDENGYADDELAYAEEDL